MAEWAAWDQAPLEDGALSAGQALIRRLRRPQNWAAFLVVWLPCSAWYLWSAHREGGLQHPIQWVPEILAPVGHLVGLIWLSPLPVQILRKRPWKIRALAAIGFAEIYLLPLVILDAWLRALSGPWPPLAGSLGLFGFFFAPMMAIAGFLLDGRERLHIENQAILAQAREAQAKELQGQLNPHVLFNALNGLAELVHKNSPSAEESIRHLSALLRRILNAIEQPAYTLGDERELLEDYLYMERLRLGERMQLRWHWNSYLDGLPLPPLMMQPLVENALKHGIVPSEEGGTLEINARRDGAYLVLEVRNTGMPLNRDQAPGVGLSTLRARMKLLCGSRDSFSLQREGDWTVATLRFEQEALHFGNELTESGVGR